MAEPFLQSTNEARQLNREKGHAFHRSGHHEDFEPFTVRRKQEVKWVHLARKGEVSISIAGWHAAAPHSLGAPEEKPNGPKKVEGKEQGKIPQRAPAIGGRFEPFRALLNKDARQRANIWTRLVSDYLPTARIHSCW